MTSQPPYNIVLIGVFPRIASLIKGGVQASTYGLAVTLKKRADVKDVIVIAPPVQRGLPMHQDRVSGIDVIFLDAPLRFLSSSFLRVGQVLEIIRKRENAVIHIHGTGLLQTFLALALRAMKYPVVWTLHGLTEKESLQRFKERRSVKKFLQYCLFRTIERICLRVMPQIIVDTEYVHAAIRTKSQVNVIPQGIFIEELRAAAGPRPTSRNLLALGVISPRKGHVLTLQAFDLVRRRIPDAKLVIAGSVSSTPYLELMQHAITTFGMQDRVDLRLNITRAEVLELLRVSRVFVLHSQEESQGIAICEAMACGLPIIATRVGGVPFVVEDGSTGILVDYNDIASFAEAIIAMLQETERYERLSSQARKSALRFDWQRLGDQVLDVYAKACLVSKGS